MTYTPWGASQGAEHIARGIVFYDTAGHGGFHLSKTRQDKMPSVLKLDEGWYEEDCDYARVIIAFPEYFTSDQIASAYKSLAAWAPDDYEAFTGKILKPGESYVKDRETFNETHKNDFVVISAIGRDDGMVEALATIGGQRGISGIDLLIPAEEYKARDHFGFVVIDASKYERVN